MPAYVFLCDNSTEKECLDRNLFGTNPGEAHKLYYSNVAIGDTVFLYNMDSGSMRGPFAAQTLCSMNIERDAWKKSRRSFPWQVRVDATRCAKIPLPIDEVQRILPLAAGPKGVMPPRELDDEQEAALMSALTGQK